MGLYIVNLDSVTTARSSRDCIKMTRIFIGGLPEDASRTELEREFEYFGRLKDVWVARNPPGFGFIVFDDARDAEDAVKEMDGKRVCGTRIRVEYARGPTRDLEEIVLHQEIGTGKDLLKGDLSPRRDHDLNLLKKNTLPHLSESPGKGQQMSIHNQKKGHNHVHVVDHDLLLFRMMNQNKQSKMEIHIVMKIDYIAE